MTRTPSRALPTRLARCAATLTVLISSAVAAGAQEAQLPPFDFQRWARFVVQDLFDARPGESYVLMADPSYYPGFIDALRAEFLEARVVELGVILFDGPRVARRRADVHPRDSDSTYRHAEDAARRRLLEDADIFLWLPYRYGTGAEEDDRRLLEHLVEGSGARGLHFHWIWPPSLLRGEGAQSAVDSLSRIYAAALDIDYSALSRKQDRIIAALRGATVRITTPSGTDLRFGVPDDAWFHKNDGRMDHERAAQARSVRDLEMELPAGALRFIPDVDSVEGVLAVPAWGGGRDVRFRFQAGRILAVDAGTNADAVRRAWARHDGDKDRLAEIVIGTNPKLPKQGPGPLPPYFGYGAGVLRIAIGENWESGGSNRSSLEAGFWFTGASLSADGTAILKDGELVLQGP